MLSTKKILILSSAHLCRNPRVVKEATALAHAGYRVTVVTASVSAEFEQVDRELMLGLPFQRVVVDYTAATIGARLADKWQRGLTWSARRLCGLGIESAQALGPARALHRAALAHPADLIIVHNELPCCIGVALLRGGRRVAADLEDWHSEDLLPADRAGRPVRRLREVERTLLHEAAYVSTTSAALAAALAERHDAPTPLVITNSFPLQPDPRHGPAGDPPSLFWFSQTIGPGRGLEEFCAAWSLTRQPGRLVLMGRLRPGYDQELLARLPAEFRSRVRFLPPVAPPELPAAIARHDIGLALEQPAIPSRDLTITNKILQYFNAGLAVVATETAGQREVMTQAPDAGILVRLEDPALAAAKIDDLLANREAISAYGLGARRAAASTYCWELEAPRLVAAVQNALVQST